MAVYGLVRSLRLPWWLWAVALAAFFAAGQVAAAPTADCPAGTLPQWTVVCDSQASDGSTTVIGARAPSLGDCPVLDLGAVEFVERGRRWHPNYSQGMQVGREYCPPDSVTGVIECSGLVEYIDLGEALYECGGGCNATPGEPAGFHQSPTGAALSSGATACSDWCQVEAVMAISASGEVDYQWAYTGASCESGVGDDISPQPQTDTLLGDARLGVLDESSLVPDSVTLSDGTVVTGADLDDFGSYVTDDYQVVQTDDAPEPLQATPAQSFNVTHWSSSNSTQINIFSAPAATTAPNATLLGPSNSNGPGADTFPGGDPGTDPGTDPGDGDCDPAVEECGDGGGCDPAIETCGGTFVGDALSAKSIGQSIAEFRGRVAASPVGSALSGVGASVPAGGTCPTADVDLAALGMGSLTLDSHCQVVEAFRPHLSAVMLFIWALIAVFAFMRL